MTSLMLKKKQQKARQNYQAYLLACSKMRKHPKISLAQLQRTLRPYCKTVLSFDVHLHIRFKFSEYTFSIQKDTYTSLDGSFYFKIVSSCYPQFSIQFSAQSTKELMQKINQKLHENKLFQL